MDIQKAVNQIFKQTVKDLLDGKYKLIEKGEYSSKLEHGKSIISIWTANGVDSCRIYGSHCDLEFPEFDTKEIKRVVFKLATTETDYMIKRELRKANKAKKKAFEIYKEKRNAVKSLKEKLSSKLDVEK